MYKGQPTDKHVKQKLHFCGYVCMFKQVNKRPALTTTLAANTHTALDLECYTQSANIKDPGRTLTFPTTQILVPSDI